MRSLAKSLLAAGGSAPDPGAAFEGALWFGLVLVLVGGSLILVRAVRRRFLRSQSAGAAIWTVHDLRRHRDEGRITPAEYDVLRRHLVQATGSTPGPASDNVVQGMRRR